MSGDLMAQKEGQRVTCMVLVQLYNLFRPVSRTKSGDPRAESTEALELSTNLSVSVAQEDALFLNMGDSQGSTQCPGAACWARAVTEDLDTGSPVRWMPQVD